MSSEKRVLITGGNGHIASRLAERYLQDSDVIVMLWLHAESSAEFESKRAILADQLKPAPGRVEYYAGDLAADNPFADINPAGIRCVVHAAAVTRFNVEAPLAQKVNVEGSEKLFKFCEKMPDLERLALLSTVYASGMHDGLIAETALDDSLGFANHYESSKWAAENILLKRYAHLPWQICRISTIISEDDDGVVGQYNAVHNTLKLLFYGLLPIIPGTPDTPLYLVTSKFVTDSLFTLLHGAPVRTIYHVTHARAQAISLSDFMEVSFRAFSGDADFRKRRVIPPLYADQKSFDSLAENIQGFGGAVMKQSVGSVAPFSKQLFSHKDVQNDQLLAQLEEYRAPDQKQVVEKICANLVLTRWGRESLPTAAQPAVLA